MLQRYGCTSSCPAHSIQIIKVEEVKASDTRRPQVKQFHDSRIRFPLPKRIQHKSMNTFSVRKPRTYFFSRCIPEYLKGLEQAYSSVSTVLNNFTGNNQVEYDLANSWASLCLFCPSICYEIFCLNNFY
ncbi:hypothetical protein NQ318_001685 [Aromia moschata]|uniref:Uncharacterized protein n=1 Tax=Aromia moschata TaxID=1265417 RepID=A0AAV8X5R3_9CUCU|nr:hypothetical protein NQ318_001685 [Aromia moschata]